LKLFQYNRFADSIFLEKQCWNTTIGRVPAAAQGLVTPNVKDYISSYCRRAVGLSAASPALEPFHKALHQAFRYYPSRAPQLQFCNIALFSQLTMRQSHIHS
jgi:hypothetical protein